MRELDQRADGDGVSRRRFLKLMGASLALAGLNGAAGCRRPEREVLPFNKPPEHAIPGKPLYYATTMVLGGQPIGILAETHEGRPTKLEGHPQHPASLGALDAFAQASILDLYDPDRSRFILQSGEPARWETDFLPMFDGLADRLRAQGGAGLAVLTERTASPAMDMLRTHLAASMPQAGWYEFEPLDPAFGEREALGLTFRCDLSNADIILALDWDGLGLEDAGVVHRRAFGRRRSIEEDAEGMNRLYVVEPHPTVTGLASDHRLRLPAGRILDYAFLLAKAVLGPSHEAVAALGADFSSDVEVDPAWISAVAEDLKAHAGRSLLAAGRRQPLVTHALVRAINDALGNTDSTIHYGANRPATHRSGTIHDLATAMRSNAVDSLLMLGGNPVYNAPSDLDFAGLLGRVETSIHLSLYVDETSSRCTWHLPAAHYLESWGDAWTGGVLSCVQPMIAPLFGGRSPLELLARLGGYAASDPYQIVRDSFKQLTGEAEFERRWREHVHSGLTHVARIEKEPGDEAVANRDDRAQYRDVLESEHSRRLKSAARESAVGAQAVEVCFAADPSVYDGRFANNGWLQECPDPVTKLTWDNAAILSPSTAEGLGAATGDMIAITAGDKMLELPALVLPGCADDSISLPLGYGRTRGGTLGNHAGFDAYALRTWDQPGFGTTSKINKTGARHVLACAQEHWSIEGHEVIDGVLRDRAIVREGSLDQYRDEPDFAAHMGVHTPHVPDIHRTPALNGAHQWAMAIDLTRCIGCSACVVACQAENNIPIVGRDEVIRGREMHWIRLDRYFRGDDPRGDVGVSVQPMLCQHCENAPCEPVCPVNATVHDAQGLNVMVYNRCIGTRYCSNNCPYKVRRFNFYDYNKGTLREAAGAAGFDGDPVPVPTAGLSLPQFAQPPMQELLKMQKNPDVTVRMRGVMEKCTFCLQRTKHAEIEMKVRAGQSKAELIPDGMVQTACQQTCPTEAIVFGNLSDPDSRVSKLASAPRNYAVLGHLNTRPRTTYLARIRNLNPDMPSSQNHRKTHDAPHHRPETAEEVDK